MSDASAPIAYLVTMVDGRPGPRWPIAGPTFSIGRDFTNHLPLTEDATVSRQHCVIHTVGASLWLEDLDSRNGTFVNGARLTGATLLPIPSNLMVGNTRLMMDPPRTIAAEATSIIDLRRLEGEQIRLPASGIFRPLVEAFFVVDLVDSTSLVKRDDVSFAKVILTMGQVLQRELETQPRWFLKCTGDGYFACFASAPAALDAALRLVPALAGRLPVDIQVSIALHWGYSQVADNADRLADRMGRNVHAVFSLEQVRHRDPELEEELRSHRHQELILMTDAFWCELDQSAQANTRAIGAYLLKGIEEETPVYRWVPPAAETWI